MVDHGRPDEGPGGAVGLTVPRTPRSVRTVRRYAVEASAALGWSSAADAVALLVTEVATNAVLHARGQQMRVRVLGRGRRLRIELDDGSSRLPRPRPARTSEEDGRGLALVEALATGWGVDQREDGKTFWFELTA